MEWNPQALVDDDDDDAYAGVQAVQQLYGIAKQPNYILTDSSSQSLLIQDVRLLIQYVAHYGMYGLLYILISIYDCVRVACIHAYMHTWVPACSALPVLQVS